MSAILPALPSVRPAVRPAPRFGDNAPAAGEGRLLLPSGEGFDALLTADNGQPPDASKLSFSMAVRQLFQTSVTLAQSVKADSDEPAAVSQTVLNLSEALRNCLSLGKEVGLNLVQDQPKPQGGQADG